MDFTNVLLLLASVLIIVIIQLLIISALAAHVLDRRPNEDVPLLATEAEADWPKPSMPFRPCLVRFRRECVRLGEVKRRLSAGLATCSASPNNHTATLQLIPSPCHPPCKRGNVMQTPLNTVAGSLFGFRHARRIALYLPICH